METVTELVGCPEPLSWAHSGAVEAAAVPEERRGVDDNMQPRRERGTWANRRREAPRAGKRTSWGAIPFGAIRTSLCSVHSSATTITCGTSRSGWASFGGQARSVLQPRLTSGPVPDSPDPDSVRHSAAAAEPAIARRRDGRHSLGGRGNRSRQRVGSGSETALIRPGHGSTSPRGAQAHCRRPRRWEVSRVIIVRKPW